MRSERRENWSAVGVSVVAVLMLTSLSCSSMLTNGFGVFRYEQGGAVADYHFPASLRNPLVERVERLRLALDAGLLSYYILASVDNRKSTPFHAGAIEVLDPNDQAIEVTTAIQAIKTWAGEKGLSGAAMKRIFAMQDDPTLSCVIEAGAKQECVLVSFADVFVIKSVTDLQNSSTGKQLRLRRVRG